MAQPNDVTHSFIVKVWFEPSPGTARWRGHITHVLDGDRRYFQNLAGIDSFIASYLRGMGTEIDACGPLRCWLMRRYLRRACLSLL